jgi:class 3 adenylate cyclase/CheY-like chemotaxis protein
MTHDEHREKSDPQVRCLVVDDDEDDRFHLIRMLRQDAEVTYQFSEAATGELGLAAAGRDVFDLIVLDYRLPGDDGLSLLPRFRKACPTAAVVFVTGVQDMEVARCALAAGAHHFLFKTELSTTAVNHGMRAALGRRRLDVMSGELNRMGDMARNLSAFVPTDLVDTVMHSAESGHETGAQRLPAGILFGDVANFSSIVEVLGPEGTIEILNRLVARFESTLRERRGILDKIIGDGVLAIFPGRAVPDDDRRTLMENMIRSGAEMIRAFDEEWRQTPFHQGIPSGFRVGLSFGEVIRGHVGSERRRDYTVVGRTVTLAKRLESQAPSNAILFDASVYQHVAPLPRALDLGAMRLKGIPETVRVYRLDADWVG